MKKVGTMRWKHGPKRFIMSQLFLLSLLPILFASCARDKEGISYALERSETTPVQAPPLLSRQYWKGKLPSGSSRRNEPRQITILDVKKNLPEAEDVLCYLQHEQENALDNGWGDLPFHFYIDISGNIFSGRIPESAAPSMDDFIEPEGHIFIAMMNDFEYTPLSAEEKQSLLQLVAWLCYEYKIPVEEARSAKDYDASLAPGRLLQAYFDQGLLF